MKYVHIPKNEWEVQYIAVKCFTSTLAARPTYWHWLRALRPNFMLGPWRIDRFLPNHDMNHCTTIVLGMCGRTVKKRKWSVAATRFWQSLVIVDSRVPRNKCLFVGPCPALAHRSHPRPIFSGRNFRINRTSPCLGNAFAASRFSSRRSPQMTSQGMRSRSWKWLDQCIRQDFRMYQKKVVTSKYLPENSYTNIYTTRSFVGNQPSQNPYWCISTCP